MTFDYKGENGWSYSFPLSAVIKVVQSPPHTLRVETLGDKVYTFTDRAEVDAFLDKWEAYNDNT